MSQHRQHAAMPPFALGRAMAALAAIFAVGTAGYMVLGGPGTSLVDAFYMTFITVATIGFGEVVNLSGSPVGRLFTVLVASSGIACYTYLFAVAIAAVVAAQRPGSSRAPGPRFAARFGGPLALLGSTLAIGTLGYLLIGGRSTSLVDAFYMAFITAATIGFGEIIDLSGNPGGRMFTVLIAVAGIAGVTWLLAAWVAWLLHPPARVQHHGESLLARTGKRLFAPAAVMVMIFVIGTTGYLVIGGPSISVLDAFYMVFITVATIGYGEIVDLTHSPAGRVFTMAIAAAGIANFTYVLSIVTAFVVEGEINEAWRRRRMNKRIETISGHYIVCGIGRVGSNVAQELETTLREYVVIDPNQHAIDVYRERHPNVIWLHGDGSEDDLLREAGIERAAGLFAVSGEDSRNLVIALTGRQLNPAIRIVARCHEVTYIEKIRRVGADAIVSPDFTGGMRIASSMIRPQVVSFLDEMLRADEGLRVEEVGIRASLVGKRLEELQLSRRDYVVLALKEKDGWAFNPGDQHRIAEDSILVVMASAESAKRLRARLGD
jgi:voltage-gated potassium channel